MRYYRLTKVLVLSFLVAGIMGVLPSCNTADNDEDDDMNLRDGAVFSMSNARNGNTVVAYRRADDGTLTQAGSFDTGGTDTCWFVVTDDGDIGFVSSFFDPLPRISSYSISGSGNLQILQADAAVTEQGTSDIALSSDSKYLYNINSFKGTIQVFEVGDDGSLNSIQTVQAHDPSDMAGVLGIAVI